MACPLKDADKSSEQCMKCDARISYVRALSGDEIDQDKTIIAEVRMEDTKKCSGCGQVKPVSEFDKQKQCKDGISGRCKQCRRDRQNQARSKKNQAKSTKKTPDTDSLNTVKQDACRREKSIYYDAGGIETIDVIRAKLTKDQFIGFLMGNVIKYSSRINHKGDPARDAEKCAAYAGWLSEALSK
jgi:hypothetical protein